MRKIIPLTVCAVSVLSVSGHAFDEQQHKVLDLARAEGWEAQFPETLQALALQESLAGKLGRLGDKHYKDWRKRSYGVMQVRFTTAKWILHRKFGHHIYLDGVLLHRLTYDDKFNIFVARIYWEYLYNQFRGHKLRWSKAVLAYNAGIGNVMKYGLSFDPNNYLMHIKQRLRALRRHKDHEREYRQSRDAVSTPPYNSPYGF
jgi:hypothetical protein